MAEAFETHVARLDDDDLDALERKLAFAVSKLTPGVSSRVRGTGEVVEQVVPERVVLEDIAADIYENAKQGVRIARHAESRPLIPLFKAAKLELPPELKVDHERLKYDFYSVEVIFSIFLSKEQFPVFAQLDLSLLDDAVDTARSTRPIRLFPGRKDIQLFSGNVEGEIGLDTSLNINASVSTTPLGQAFQSLGALPIKASADATAEASANMRVKAALIVGPLAFSFCKAALEVEGESNPEIRWRYNLQSELSGTNEFKSLLILKVAQEVSSLRIAASLSVVPCKRRWLLFRETLPALPAKAMLPVEIPSRKK